MADHHFEFLSFKEGCTDSSECTLVKMPRWKSHVAAHSIKPLFVLLESVILILDLQSFA